MKNKSIYELKVNEIATFHDNDSGVTTHVQRVPGGWIYTIVQNFQNVWGDHKFDEKSKITSQFIPFNNEFLMTEGM